MTDVTASALADALRNRYVLDRELGRGGMATVYLAHDLKHDRKVAVKVLHPEFAAALGAERFVQEIKTTATLQHPHILPLFDSGTADGFLYYVMPYVEGETLRAKLDREKQLGIDESVKITTAVADALDYAHRQGVVHRDIKPENIMLHEGHALVADFGLGKALSAVEGAALTETGLRVGTPAYMSPEQAAGDNVDGRSDIYSLGCMLYEMLAGEQPFTGRTAQAVIAKRFVQTPAVVTSLREGVPRPLARAVQKALARTPIDRFQTGSMLVAALAEPDAPPPRESVHAPSDKSIAVLPFANMSADPENEFFADGVTEEILNALSQIAELRVAGRTSAFSFKGKSLDPRAIGEQLNVRTVLEGSVRRAGNRVRITAQLIDVTDGYNLWSERYDREIEDVFAVQDEIASAIAGKMKTTLQGGAAARSQRATHNIEAYEAYLKGRALLYRRGNAIKQSLIQMEKALSLDPEYGLAWAGMADTYSLLGYHGLLTPEIARAKARDAVASAIRFAPDLAEAHNACALFALLYEWDWDKADRSFRRALQLNPGYIQAGAWYHVFYQGLACARWDDALRGLKAFQERDQLSGFMAAVVSISYSIAYHDQAAVEWADRALALEPDAFLSLWARNLAYQSVGDWPRAVEAADATLAASGRQPLPLIMLSLSLIESGDAASGRAVYDEMRSRAVREHVPPMGFALVAAALGEREAAIAYASEAVRRHDPLFVMFSLGWPGTHYLRALSEQQQLLTDIRLPGWVDRPRE